MKRIIQIILFLFLVFISFIFYKIYFEEDKKSQINSLETQKQLPESSENNLISESSQNNLIKNLKYEIKLDQDNQYIITAELSEISYENNVELVNMQKVLAIFIDNTNIPLTITSDRAVYNNANYNTNFSENIKITYLDHIILSDKMDLDFNKNIISIYKNVKYEGLNGTIKADNIRIDLITKKIKIYMDNNKEKVEVTTKE